MCHTEFEKPCPHLEGMLHIILNFQAQKKWETERSESEAESVAQNEESIAEARKEEREKLLEEHAKETNQLKEKHKEEISQTKKRQWVCPRCVFSMTWRAPSF